MSSRLVLRAVAYAIAIAGVLDPVWTQTVARYETLDLVASDATSAATAARLHATIRDFANARIVLHDRASAASACPPNGKCVMLSTGWIPHPTDGEVIGVVRVIPERPAVIQQLDAPLRAHRDAVSSLRVHLHRPVTRIEIFDGTTLVGAADVNQQTTLDVPWLPVAPGARALRVEAGGERADVGVVVAETPARVLMYEPQATWLGTFVRRAIEEDSRFELQGRTRLAPPVSVARGSGPSLSSSALERTEVAVVSSPERLTRAEVDLLERFVTDDGGSLVILMDQRPDGAAMRLLPGIAAERREREPQSIGLLRASEWLSFAPAVGVNVLASVDEQPVIVSRLAGRGRVIVSGALDAWRFRRGSAFDTFWTTVAWDAASLAMPSLLVRTDRAAARPGEEIQVVAEARRVEGDSEWHTRGEAEANCDGERQFIRLWPGTRPGVFRGSLRGAREGQCVISVAVDGVSGSAPVTFDDDFVRVRPDDNLGAVAAAFNAVLTADVNDDRLLDAIRAHVSATEAPLEGRPMRSPWWLLPFASCLGVEWWLRRRSGVS